MARPSMTSHLYLGKSWVLGAEIAAFRAEPLPGLLAGCWQLRAQSHSHAMLAADKFFY